MIEIFGSALGLFNLELLLGSLCLHKQHGQPNRYKPVWNCCGLWYLHCYIYGWILSLVSRRTTCVRTQNLFWIPDSFLYCLKLRNNWRTSSSSCLYSHCFFLWNKDKSLYMISCWLIIEIEYFIQLIYLYPCVSIVHELVKDLLQWWLLLWELSLSRIESKPSPLVSPFLEFSKQMVSCCIFLGLEQLSLLACVPRFKMLSFEFFNL